MIKIQYNAVSASLLVPGLIAVTAFMGCQESTDPDPRDGVEIVFLPAAINLDAVQHQPITLSAFAVGADTFQTVFTRDGEVLATTLELTYVPAAAGADSILATMTVGDEVHQHLWRLQVAIPAGGLPALPRGFRVGVADRVYVEWAGVLDHEGPVALDRYELRARPGGVLDEAHWDAAIPVAEVVFSADQAVYELILDVGPPAIPIGAEVGFGLRLRDVNGNLSPLARDEISVPPGYFAEGTVSDLEGRPLAGVEVTWNYYNGRAYTDDEGRYRSHFLPRDRLVSLRYTRYAAGVPDTTAWYGTVIQARNQSAVPPNVVLLPVSSIDPVCDSWRYDGDFLNYMRDMTFTDPALYPRPKYITAHWRELPITLHVIEGWNDAGTFALHALADSAVTMWNERLGRPFFTAAADPDSAQLTIFFDSSGMGLNIGIARIVEPYYAMINTVIPRKMTIQTRTGFDDPTFALEVLLHELGHALCLGNHTRCNGGIHLMQSNPQDIIEDRWPASPISDDEVRLIHTIYALPPDYPLDMYRVN